MHRIWSHRFRWSTLWLLFCLSMLGGIGLAKVGWHQATLYVWVSALVSCLAIRKQKVVSCLAIIAFGISLGLLRGNAFMQKLAVNQSWQLHPVVFTATAATDSYYGKHSQLAFVAKHVRLNDGEELAGAIQVSGFGLNAVFQGDEVQVTGKLYPGYAAYQSSISYAKLSLIEHHPSLVAQVRRKFSAGMQSALPEPLAPFAMGLLIGQRADLPANVKQDLLMVGLTHIIAVSGYNLTIMLHAAQKLLGKRSKRITTWLSIAFIGLFLLLTGLSASIVRAAIVSMLSIVTLYYGRILRPQNLILIAAVITGWANPFYVWGDLSWYLSFLAFFGVLVIAPEIESRLWWRVRNSAIVGIAVESMSAEIMTLPFILWFFGQMSLVGLPANMLIAALVPLAMLVGLIAGVVGMLWSAFAGWFAWPARFVLTYMLDAAHLLATIPGVFRENIGLSLRRMLGLYGLILVMSWLLQRKTKLRNNDKITDTILIEERGLGERSQQMVYD